MLDINVKADIRDATKYLDAIGRKHIPFATALALTGVAVNARDDVKKNLGEYIDRPTPFTRQGFLFKKATKQNLTAHIYAKDIQAGYLDLLIYGGVRRRKKGSPVIVPKDAIGINNYGNIPRGRIKKLIRQGSVFVANIKGVYGVWQRGTNDNGIFTPQEKAGRKKKGEKQKFSKSDAIRLLAVFEKKAKYKKGTLPLKEIIEKITRRDFRKEFDKALIRALRTAK